MMPDTTTLSQYEALSNAILDWEIIAKLRRESCVGIVRLDSLTRGRLRSNLGGGGV